MSRPDFEKMAKEARGFAASDRPLVGHIPTLWDRFGGDDFRACAELGPLYG